MSKISIVQLILCFVLTDIYCKDEFDIQSKYDACGCDTAYDGNHNSYEEFFVSTERVSIFCCAVNFLAGIDFTVSWAFQRASYPDYESTFFRTKDNCYGQRITSTNISLLDAGVYNCTVRGNDGSSHGKSITLVLHDSGSYRGKPLVYNSSGNVYTEIGSSIKLSCFFFMANSTNDPDIFWRRTFLNETTYLEVIARALPDVTQSPLIERNGYYSSELIVKRVTEDHIGNYSCQMVTWSDIVYQNMTVFNQEHPEKSTERKYEVLSSCVFIVLTGLFISSCLVYRWRMDISLKWRKLNYGKSDLTLQEFSHDVFIVSGPSVGYWVHTVLLNKLEGVWFYDCFFPDRDMLAGEECVEAICDKLGKSQRTIIVITDCLLRSGWCTFMMNQAVHNALANSSKVMAINLSDTTSLANCSAEAQNIMRVLKYIKKIKCPQDLLPDPKTMSECFEEAQSNFPLIKLAVYDEVTEGRDEEGQSNINSKDKREAPKQCLLSTHSIPNLPYSKSLSQLTVPVFHPSSSLSDLEEKKNLEIDWKIPKDQSQRVVNMISGSSEFIDSRSRWKPPGEVMEAKEMDPQSHHGYKHNYIFDYEIPFPKCVRRKLYSESSECPLSPCSNTLFFADDAPTHWNSKKRKTFMEILGCFFFGNPKDLFWKKLCLHLPTKPLKLTPAK